jgi:hypothetical protein
MRAVANPYAYNFDIERVDKRFPAPAPAKPGPAVDRGTRSSSLVTAASESKRQALKWVIPPQVLARTEKNPKGWGGGKPGGPGGVGACGTATVRGGPFDVNFVLDLCGSLELT